jgi:hypothetical protein
MVKKTVTPRRGLLDAKRHEKTKRDIWAEEQGQLGKAQDEMKAFIIERREGRILDDVERQRVFQPLTTPITKLLKDALYISKKDDATGQILQVPIFEDFLYEKQIDPETGKEASVPIFSMDALKTALEGANNKSEAIRLILEEQNTRNTLIYTELIEMNDKLGNLNIQPVVIPPAQQAQDRQIEILEEIEGLMRRNLQTARSMDTTLGEINNKIEEQKAINDAQSINTIAKLDEVKQEIIQQGINMENVIKNIKTIAGNPLNNPIFDIPFPDLTNPTDDTYTQEQLEAMVERYHSILLKAHNESYKGLKGTRTYTSDDDLFKLLDNKTQATKSDRKPLTAEEKGFIDEFTKEANSNSKLWQVSFQRLPRNKLFEKKLGDLDNIDVKEVEKILQPKFLQKISKQTFTADTVSTSAKKTSKKSPAQEPPQNSPASSSKGQGYTRRGHIGSGYGMEVHGYKMKPDGTFGNLKIDFPKLVMYHQLVVSNAQGQNVINEKSDPNLVELLTKRYYKNKNYSELSKQQFKRLVEMSDLPIDPLTNKMELVRGEGNQKVSGVKVFLGEVQLIDQLEKIIGSINAGNTSDAMENEGREIILQLYKIGKMSKDDYRLLYEKYFKI